jgi:hypothetical protein
VTQAKESPTNRLRSTKWNQRPPVTIVAVVTLDGDDLCIRKLTDKFLDVD